MTTLAHPGLTHTAAEFFLAATMGAVATVMVLIWLVAGITGPLGGHSGGTPVPTAQPQAAPVHPGE